MDSHVSEHPRVLAARNVCIQLRKGGWTAYWVGGAVRDLLLQTRTAPKDIDIATDASYREICRLLPQTRAIGKAFGVGLVREGEFTFEIATFRKEAEYADRRHPSLVGPGSLEEDSERRDFTVNALYLDPIDEVITDFHDGVNDLSQGILRCVGNPALRLHEDPLRILRLYRFAANLNFKIDAATECAALALSEELIHISRERVLLEISKLKPTRIAKFASSLAPFQQTLFGQSKNPVYVPDSRRTEHSSLPTDPIALSFPGTLFALLCASNEGFDSRNWPQTFENWPMSLEEKAQLEFFQRLVNGEFSPPETEDENEWRKFLELLRWMSRQTRISAAAATWILKWPRSHSLSAEVFLNCLTHSLQKCLNENTIGADTPLSDYFELIVRKQAAPLRNLLNHTLKDEPVKAILGWSRLIADSHIFLKEIGCAKENIPTFMQTISESKIASLLSTAKRWSAMEVSRRKK